MAARTFFLQKVACVGIRGLVLHVDAASVAASTHRTETHLWAATVWNWEGDGLRLGEMGVYFISDVWHRCVVAKSRPVSFFFKKLR